MKIVKLLPVLLIVLILFSCNTSEPEDVSENTSTISKREYYQLKVFSFESEKQIKMTDNFLKDAYLPGLKRLGINNVGVFKLRRNEIDTISKTYILTPFNSIEQFMDFENQLNKDELYLTAGSAYLNATHDQAPYSMIESTLMRAFQDFPKLQPSKLTNSRAERIYELRSYGSPTEAYFKNKVEMFNAGGEIKLFDKLDFNSVFYGEVISGSEMPNLMYMTTFSDQKSRDQHWKDFVDSAEWKEMAALEKYKNNVSRIERIYLYPTEYSDY